MEIKNLSYAQFSMIREAIQEKREKIWKKTIVIPFRRQLKKKSMIEVHKIKKDFESDYNQFRENGVCNALLKDFEEIESVLKDNIT